MRLYKKEKCLETLKLMEEAHGEIIKYVEKGMIEDAADLLTQCQQGAVSVGTAIEESEGEGTGTVRVLEEYCESAYELYMKLMGEDTNAEDFSSMHKNDTNVNIRQEIKKLRTCLKKAVNGITYDIRTRKEVVFLPYKASMWDSLETVWERADKDEDINAYVIPIPYYDKNPDGTFKKEHYEINDFPDNVPVIRYDEYDFMGRHPDEIYIHNPYDEYNNVTGVHPAFYSPRLKEYTDKLIYIPYFVLGDIDPDNENALKGIEHFVTVPGVVNADKVIVQDENFKKAYVKILTKMYAEVNDPIRGKADYWNKRISGEGSPKVEKIMRLKREDFIIPDEWERLIGKSDGERKKVIFYNTSVSAFLKNDEGMINKIRDSLKVFKENKEDITLLWRPHPLTEATLSSMRPGLYDEYGKIRDEYIKEGWGIYDDTPDMDRAIIISDAYYGDMSSIVWLYKRTGKPVMIQNCEILNGEEE